MEKNTGIFRTAYLVSVGYMDPGNWATDIAGGSAFGYKLIWVLLMSNLIAVLLQSLSATIGHCSWNGFGTGFEKCISKMGEHSALYFSRNSNRGLRFGRNCRNGHWVKLAVWATINLGDQPYCIGHYFITFPFK